MMKKILLVSLLASLSAASNSAPVVVTPGSNAGYLYFPKGSAGGQGSGVSGFGRGGVTIDAMQLAPTACYTTSGSVALPSGFTRGSIQAIVVGGGQGHGAPGQSSSITHASIGTVTAAGGADGVAGSAGGRGGGATKGLDGSLVFGFGGGGGGYLGRGGNGNAPGGGHRGDGPQWSQQGGAGGGSRGGGGQGWGYGSPEGGAPGPGIPSNAGEPAPIAATGPVGAESTAPKAIMCPNVPSAEGSPGTGGTGFGAGAGGWLFDARGKNSGQIATIVFRYESGPITVVVGAGGPSAAPGVVALRFIPE